MTLSDTIEGSSAGFDTKRSPVGRRSAAPGPGRGSVWSPTEDKLQAVGGRAKPRKKASQSGTASSRRADQGAGSEGVYALSRTSAAGPTAALTGSSDDALISAIAKGDHQAMRELFARHSKRIYRFVLRFTKRPSLTEDLVNDTFLTVWHQADKFKFRSQVSTWLLGIARFKAISAMRQRTHEELDWDAIAAIEDPADGPEATLEKTDRHSLLRDCLTRLSPAQREVIDLVYYHDRSVADVSRITGIPTATVKTRMFYARKKLAQLLQQAGTSGAQDGAAARCVRA